MRYKIATKQDILDNLDTLKQHKCVIINELAYTMSDSDNNIKVITFFSPGNKEFGTREWGIYKNNTLWRG